MVARYRKNAGRRRRPSNFPSSKFGRVYVPRGTAESMNLYGADYRTATGPQLAARRQFGWRGKGKYNVGRDFRHWAGGAVRDVGKWFAHNVQPGLTSAMQARLGEAVPGYSAGSGRGAYTAMEGSDAQQNQLINTDEPDRVMHTTGDETNDVVITHSEFLQDISPTSTAFQTQFFQNLNPGLSATFPWLAQLAQYFEEYEWGSLIFELRSMVTEGNSTAAGTVIHCTQYNPGNPAFTSKANMENYDYAVSHKVTEHGHHGVECDPAKRSGSVGEYVRSGPVPTGQDIKTYDLGSFQLATSGATANVLIGELWVHYSVKLRKTKIPAPGQLLAGSIAQTSLVSTQTASNAFGNNTWTASVGSSIAVAVAGTTTLVLTLPSSVVAAVSYDLILSFAAATANLGANQYLAGFGLSGTNCTTTTPTYTSMGGTYTAANATFTLARATFTPNGVGTVVLTLTQPASTIFPTSGAVTISISPSAL